VRYILILTIYFLIACDPCDDCESIIFEPTVEMVFINQDSLIHLTDSINKNLRSDSILNDSINFYEQIVDDFVDSIRIWKDSLIDGVPFDTLFLFNEIIRRSDSIVTWGVASDTLTSFNAQMNNVISVINSGSVKITNLSYRETGGTLFLEDDSSTIFSLPISYDKSFLTYDITIEGDSTYFVTLDFDLVEETDMRRNVLIRAENISITDTDFQDFDNCETNCNDSEAVFTFYF